MRLISCVALLMVIPAVALLTKGEDLSTNKAKVASLPKVIKNNKPDSATVSLLHNQANTASSLKTLKADDNKDIAAKKEAYSQSNSLPAK